ncbi:MAG: 50S ribosomal protein L23 [Dehalococcoidia bacterium]
MHPYDVILRPIITEKATVLAGDHKYAFEVDRRANKEQIRAAVEIGFSVHVTKVNTMNVRGKRRRMGRRTSYTRSWKKAIVTLQTGESIQIFEGI